jgi:hypothetical protein
MSKASDLRKKKLFKKLSEVPKAGLEDMLANIYNTIWSVEALDYPNAEVSGADVIEAIGRIFAARKISPKEIP